jgi:hypothetical protein
MSAMGQKRPVLFATLVGGAIGGVIGLAFSAFECALYWMLRSMMHHSLERASFSRLFVVIVSPTIVCFFFGALVGAAVSAKLFGKRTSVLFTGFLVGAILSIVTGLGLWPLGGPLLSGDFLRHPAGMLITICLVVMMATHPVWPDKWWTPIISAFGVAGWILCPVVIGLAST